MLCVLIRNASHGYSLEVPHRGATNEYQQHVFYKEIKKIYLETPQNILDPSNPIPGISKVFCANTNKLSCRVLGYIYYEAIFDRKKKRKQSRECVKL